MGYNKIILALFLALVPFLTNAQTEDWPRFELYQLVQGQDSGIFVITDADSNLIFAPFMRFRFDPDTALIINNDTVAYRIHFQEGLGISIEYDSATNTYLFQSLAIEDTVYNGTASTIPKGTPLYAAGVQGNYWSVAPANAADTAKMPVVAIAGENIASGAEGIGLIKGHIKQVNTTGLADGDEVYVAAGGGYTNVKPKGENVLVQRLGTVIKGNSANGSGIINLGDPQSVSNLNPNKIFIGGADSTVTTINLTDSLSKYLLTVNYIIDSTRLFQDTILRHYQNASIVKSDTIRLASGVATPSYWDSVGTGNLVNTNTGNVGIGQSSPAYKLDVNGTLNVQSTARFNNGNVVVSSDSYIGILNSSPLFPLDVSGEARITGNTFLAFPNGKVLIDTSAGTTGEANYKLEVNGDVNLIGSGTAYRINGVPILGGKWSDGSGGAIYYNSGFVGIGDATPSYTLEVNGNMVVDGNTFYVDSANNRIGIGLLGPSEVLDVNGDINGRSYTSMGIDSSTGVGWHRASSGTFGIFTDGNNRLLVNSTGEVTIRNLTTNGTVYSNNSILTNTNPSDKRLKENITNLKYGLNEINKLNPVSFQYKDSNDKSIKFGYIAQEAKEIIPEAVQIQKDGYFGMYPDKIDVIAVKAIQELYEMVISQQTQIEELKQEVKRLKNKK